MDIELGADIIGTNGEKMGVVDGLVVEPRTGQINSIIVRKGFFFPTDKIIPIDRVTGVKDDGVHLSLSNQELEHLLEYVDADYIWPPAGYYAGPGYRWPSSSVYTSDLLVDEHVHDRQPDAIILSEGTLIVDKDGDEIGTVSEIVADERGRVAGFRAEGGLLIHHEHYIPAHVVASGDDTVIQLSVDKDELDKLGRRGAS